MGYNVKPGVVEKYSSTLEQIKIAIEAGGQATFVEDHPAHLAKRRDQIHWFLRCAKIFTNEANGRYADLRDRVKVSVEWHRHSVIVVGVSNPTHYNPTLATPGDPSEHDILRLLRTDADRPVIVQEFTPSEQYAGDEWLEQEGDKLGYEVTVVGNGPFACVAKRKPKRSAFDIIKR